VMPGMPPTPPPDYQHWIDGLLVTLFAAFTGILGYFLRSKGIRWRARVAQGLVEGLSASAIGAITNLSFYAMGLPVQASGAAAGFLGLIGARSAMTSLEEVAYKKFGIERRDRQSEGRREDDVQP